jgi:DNA-binding winged helix-turn-helix (wHTH) protein
MSNSPREGHALFGPFQFDLGSRELRKNGVRLPLEDKPAQLLSALLSQPGLVVSREQLQKLLWPNGVHVDYQHGLNKSINKLRLVLGDDRAKPRYIETLSRRGYRFVGLVEIVCKAGPAPATTSVLEIRSQSGRRENAPQPVVSPQHGDRLDSDAGRVAIASNRRVIVGSLIAAFLGLLFLAAGGRFFGPKSLISSVDGRTTDIKSIVIENDGALDPLNGGFKLHPIGEYEVEVLLNSSHKGWDRLRLTSKDQTYYYRTLTSAEKAFALSHDWKLICTCALEQGALSTNVDFGPGLSRFDMDLLREGDKYYVALSKQISPTMEWQQKIEFSGVEDIDHPHTFELRYDHSSQKAELWVDGHRTASGYAGHTQFVEDRGVIFGAFSYSSPKPAIGVFRSVRFEAH